MAQAILELDEIRVALHPLRRQPGQYLLRRRYLACFEIEGQTDLKVAVFEWFEFVCDGATGFNLMIFNTWSNSATACGPIGREKQVRIDAYPSIRCRASLRGGRTGGARSVRKA